MSGGRQSSDAPAPAKPVAREVADVSASSTGLASAFSRAPIGNQAMQRLLRAHGILPKLKVSQPGDALEQEADRVAEQVLRAPQPDPSRNPETGNRGALRQSRVSPRELTPSFREAPDPLRPLLQRRAPAAGDGPAIRGEFADSPQHAGSGGQPLSAATRQFFEPRFRADFSKVRVHTDASAGTMAESIDAAAFTHGSNIYFAPGAHDPASSTGRRLLAHELAHTLQQGSSSGVVARQVHLIHRRDVSRMTYEQRMYEALEAALPAFGTWFVSAVLSLLLWAAGIFAAVSFLIWLCPPAWAAWISIIVGSIGVLMGLGFLIHGVATIVDAWTEFDAAVRAAATHEELRQAGTTFGSRTAGAVVEIAGGILSIIGGARGIIAGVRGLPPLPPNGPIRLAPVVDTPPPAVDTAPIVDTPPPVVDTAPATDVPATDPAPGTPAESGSGIPRLPGRLSLGMSLRARLLGAIMRGAAEGAPPLRGTGGGPGSALTGEPPAIFEPAVAGEGAAVVPEVAPEVALEVAPEAAPEVAPEAAAETAPAETAPGESAPLAPIAPPVVAARTRPPSGTYRSVRARSGEYAQDAWLGPRQVRAGLEAAMMSAAEYCIAQIAEYERAHSIGAGLGAESGEAIRLAPRLVNQVMQRLGIERFLSELREIAADAGTRIHLRTTTVSHARTLRLASIHYLVEFEEGGRRITLFEAAIEVRTNGQARCGVRLPGSDTITWGPWFSE